jgi:hypothetical protein
VVQTTGKGGIDGEWAGGEGRCCRVRTKRVLAAVRKVEYMRSKTPAR